MRIACILCVLTFLVGGTPAATAGYELELARDGKTEYRVVIGANASTKVKAIAEDFAEHFKAITGASIPILTDENKRVEKEVLIGPNKHVSELMVGIDLSRMEDEEYLITTVDSSLVLTGGKRRGTPNAVYTFLDEILGCRWYAPDCTVIPNRPTLRVESIYWKRKPSFISRMADMSHVAHSEWSARVRFNGFRPSLCFAKYLADITREDIIRETGAEPQGVFYPRIWAKFLSDPRLDGSWIPAVNKHYPFMAEPCAWHHTLHAAAGGLLTPGDQTAHPEYFALVDGTRRPEGCQLCYTNPELPGVIASRAKQWLKDNPKATFISIAQPDVEGYCQCDRCQALQATFTYAPNRTADGRFTRPEWGTPSLRAGPVMTFVNKVAQEIAEDYPDVLVYTLAYNYTLSPPDGIKMEPNVVIRYASWSPCCYYHTYASCRFNEGFYANWTNLQHWTQAANHVWVQWYDTYTYPFHPMAMMVNWTQLLQELRDVGVEGIYNFAFRRFIDEEWMQPLRAYVYAKTMWDADRDTWDVIEDFASGYYGPAAEPMLEYIRQTQDLASYQDGTPQPFIRKYLKEHPNDPSRFHQSTGTAYLRPGAVRHWEDLLDKAKEKAAGDETILRRIAIDRLSVDFPAMLYLEPDDPVRKTAHERFFRTVGEFCECGAIRCADDKMRPIEGAAEYFKASKALVLEK